MGNTKTVSTIPRQSAAWRTPILATKLGPPHHPGDPLTRGHLLSRLDLGLTRRLVVVSAAAGFGKTTLLAQWHRRLVDNGWACAWVSLDEDDGDLQSFLAYVLAALRRAAPEMGDETQRFLDQGTPMPSKALVASLINDLAAVARPLVLILDDYHRISGDDVHHALNQLLAHMPANLHIALASRRVPALSLPLLQAQDQVVVLDANDLRFAALEAREFFRRQLTDMLSDDTVDEVHGAAEGWVAGLQLVTICLRGQSDPDAFLAAFSGRTRAVYDYLETDVLGNLPRPLVEFLLRTSILERLCAPLCAAVTCDANALEHLTAARDQQLFLQPLDQEGHWFRYHRLFADFLRYRLQRERAAEVPELHRRACDWYAANGQWNEAVRHALAAGQVELATDLIERCARDMVEHGGLPSLLSWLGRLPRQHWVHRPQLALNAAWALSLSYRLDEASALIEQLDHSLTDPADRMELHAAQALHAAFRDDSVAALAYGEKVVAAGTALPWSLGIVGNVLRFSYHHAGRFGELAALPGPYLGEHGDPDPFQVVYQNVLLALADTAFGAHPEAGHRLRYAYRQAESVFGVRSSAAALVAGVLADLCYEWNDLDRIPQLLAQRMEVIDAACPTDIVLRAYRARARALALGGDPVLAHTVLNHAQQVGHRRRWRRLEMTALYERLRLCLAADDLVEAERLVFRMQALVNPVAPTQSSVDRLIHEVYEEARARLLLARGDYTSAVRIVERQMETLEGAQFHYRAVRHRILLARVLDAAGLKEKALRTLQRALPHAEASGLVRAFVDEGPGIRLLLAEIRDNAKRRNAPVGALTYMDHVMAAFGQDRREGQDDHPLLEALSLRERDILILVADGLSNKEIARTLDISLETVKWHLKNLYGKLNVSSRTQAVHRSRSLGLLG